MVLGFRSLVLSVTLILVLAMGASAQELRVSAPQHCLQHDELWSRLQHRAHTLGLQLPSQLRLDLQVNATDEGYTAVLRAAQGDNKEPLTRTLHDADCMALGDALLLTILLLLPAEISEPRSIPTPALNSGGGDRGSLAETGKPRGFGIGVAALIDEGSLPTTVVGLRVWLAAHREKYSFGIDGTLFAPVHERFGGDKALTGNFQLWTAGLHLCRHLPASLHGCIAAEAGAIHASAEGVRQPANKIVAWIAAAASLGYRVHITSGWYLTTSINVVTPFRRHKFVVKGANMIHQASWLSLRPQLGLEWEFF